MTPQYANKFFLKNIEYNIVEHCNLRCAGCDHSSPLMPKKFIPVKEFVADLNVLENVVHVGTLKLIGGEPTLHPDILIIIKKAKESGISERLAIITNGTLLHRMPGVFWEYIDVLKISIYPGIKLKLSQSEIENICLKFNIELAFVNQDVFRHTALDEKIEDKALIHRIYEACELPVIHACHTLRNGKLYKCSPAAFLRDRIRRSGGDFNDKDDFVDIYKAKDLKNELANYMARNIPLAACSYCLGTSGKVFKHHQVSRDKQASIRVAPLDLIDESKLSPIMRKSTT